MAYYPPPTEDLPIFDNSVFVQSTDNVTVQFANNNYLKYPYAQGPETLQDVTVAGDAQFDGTVNVGSGTTANNLPVLNTNKSTVNIGSSGQGTLNVNCALNFGGFGNITMTGSTLNLTSNARINQGTSSTITNNLTGTVITTPYGSSSNTSLKVFDGSNNQGVSIVPNATAGAFNPLSSAGDVVLFGSGGGTNSKGLNLCSWSSTNSGIKILPASTTIGAGGTSTIPTTGTTYDGTNITFTSPNPPLSTATQPAYNDSSNKIPTTAWVQSAISGAPGVNPLPYLWLNYYYATAAPLPTKFGAIALNFTGSSWNVNEYFTIRYVFSCEWNTSSGVNCAYNYTYAGIMNVYPNRVPTYGTLNSALLNGSVGGSVPAFGTQWYYSQEYSGQYNYNPANYSTNPPIYITSTSQSQIAFNYNLLAGIVPAGCPNVLTCTIEILQKGPSGQTITSSGLFGNYQNTF